MFGADPNSVEANAVLKSNKRGKNSVKSFNEMVVQIGDCSESWNFMRDEYDNFIVIDKNGNKVKWDKSARNYCDVNGNREHKEYEKKQAECDKLKADYEKAKNELVRGAFPEIEQEKLASKIKIKKLDETARQDFFMHPHNDGKQY